MTRKLSIIALLTASAVCMRATEAAESNCTQNRVDGTIRPSPSAMTYITSTPTVVPFYQWENDNGYCGEVSMIQAGLNNGQWMSQFNARKVCGATLPDNTTPLSQSGPDGWCAANKKLPNYNAQLLLENPDGIVTGPNPFANAAACLANSRLSATTYPYLTGFRSPNGCRPGETSPCNSGFRDFLSWVKSEVISGHQVTIGVLVKYGSDPQYDHEVSIVGIGTNHLPASSTYYDDDVLFFDDHGGYTLRGNGLYWWTAIPPGAGADNNGCTPYIYGYTFGSLAHTRSDANTNSSPAYSIVFPGVPANTSTGVNGYLGTVPITTHNYGFSVSGAIDNSTGRRHLLPIQLSIPSATMTNRVANPPDPIAGWEYENSMIGTSVQGASCTNTPPQYWMNPLTLRVTISGLTNGVNYNLYEYDFPSVNGIGTAAALPVPTGDFNRYNSYPNALKAAHAFSFTATGPTFVQTVTTTSDRIIVFRAVPASAP